MTSERFEKLLQSRRPQLAFAETKFVGRGGRRRRFAVTI